MKQLSLLGQKLDESLQEARMTKADLARHFGVTPQSVQTWFKSGTISKDKYEGLAKLFRKPLSYWLDAEEESLLSDDERMFLQMYRDLPAKGQAEAQQDLNKIHNKHRPQSSAANPFANAPPPGATSPSKGKK